MKQRLQQVFAIIALIAIAAAVIWVVIIICGGIASAFKAWQADFDNKKTFYAEHCKIIEKGTSTGSYGIVKGEYAYISTEGKTKFQCDDGTTYIEDAGMYE